MSKVYAQCCIKKVQYQIKIDLCNFIKKCINLY